MWRIRDLRFRVHVVALTERAYRNTHEISELPSAGSARAELTSSSSFAKQVYGNREGPHRVHSASRFFAAIAKIRTKDTPLKKNWHGPGAHPIAGTAAPAAAVLGGSSSSRQKRLRLRCRLQAGSGGYSNQTPEHRIGSRGGVQGLRIFLDATPASARLPG
jgi:hypothetical protein